jgi:hypothetical protein
MARAPMTLKIEREGQPYVDELVLAKPRNESLCEAAVRRAFGRPRPRQIVLGYNRIPLRWNTPSKKVKQ